MVTRKVFINEMVNLIKASEKEYGKPTGIRLFLDILDSYIGIKGYERSPSSNQQIIRHKGKIIYNSDEKPPSANKMAEILAQVVDYSKLIKLKKSWVVKYTDTRNGNKTPYYSPHKTRKTAEQLGKVYAGWGYMQNVALMREKYPRQYHNEPSGLEFIKTFRGH